MDAVSDTSRPFRLNSLARQGLDALHNLPGSELDRKGEEFVAAVGRRIGLPMLEVSAVASAVVTISNAKRMATQGPVVFCLGLFAQYGMGFARKWREVRDRHLSPEVDGQLRIGSRVQPFMAVERLVESNERDPRPWLDCWTHVFEREIHAINQCIFELARDHGTLTGPATRRMSAGVLFNKVRDISTDLGVDFPFYSQLPRLRNSYAHAQWEWVADNRVDFFKSGKIALSLSLDEISENTRRDLTFAGGFPLSFNVAQTLYYNAIGLYDEIWNKLVERYPSLAQYQHPQ